jgi:hypothetical protein
MKRTKHSFARPKMKSPGQLPLPARAKSVHTAGKRGAVTVANHTTAVLQSDDRQMKRPGQQGTGAKLEQTSRPCSGRTLSSSQTKNPGQAGRLTGAKLLGVHVRDGMQTAPPSNSSRGLSGSQLPLFVRRHKLNGRPWTHVIARRSFLRAR